MTARDRDRPTRRGTVLLLSVFGSSHAEVVAEAAAEVGLEVIDRPKDTDAAWVALQAAEVVVAVLEAADADILIRVGMADVLGKKLLVVAPDTAQLSHDMEGILVVRAGAPGLSRRIARELQRLRDLPILERMTVPMPTGDRIDEVVDVEVVQVQPGVAVVRTFDGREALLLADDLSWTRKVRDLRRVLQLGQALHGALVGGDDEQARFSVRALEADPWPTFENLVGRGTPVEATVFSWQPRIGLFVDVGSGVNGLVPRSTLPDDARFESGALVTVEVTRVDRETKEVELRLLSASSSPDAPPIAYEVGDRVVGTVTHVQPGRGYLLVVLPDGFSAILPFRRMSTTAEAALAAGNLKPGDTLPVEVAQVDRRRRRVEVSDEMRPPQAPVPVSPRRLRRRKFAAEELGRRVKVCRKQAGWTHEELAERAGLHRTYIGHVERGEVNPTVSTIVRVANALGVDPGDLVRGLQPE